MTNSERPMVSDDWWSKISVPRHTRWAYLAPALASFMFVGHAWEDAGWQGGGPYAFVLVMSLVQLLRPTVLGWLLCAIPCLVYLVLFIAEAPLDPIAAWFLLIGVVPALALAWARPRFQQPTGERGSRTTGEVGDDAG